MWAGRKCNIKNHQWNPVKFSCKLVESAVIVNIYQNYAYVSVMDLWKLCETSVFQIRQNYVELSAFGIGGNFVDSWKLRRWMMRMEFSHYVLPHHVCRLTMIKQLNNHGYFMVLYNARHRIEPNFDCQLKYYKVYHLFS